MRPRIHELIGHRDGGSVLSLYAFDDRYPHVDCCLVYVFLGVLGWDGSYYSFYLGTTTRQSMARKRVGYLGSTCLAFLQYSGSGA